MNLYATSTLTAIVAGLPRPSSFLLDTFFPFIQQEAVEEIYFDVRDGTRRLAPFCAPIVTGKLVETEGFRTEKFAPAYIKAKMVLDTNRPLKRVLGETIGGELHPADRLKLLTVDLLNDQVDMIQRRMEVMASEAMRLGTVTVSGEKYPTTVVNFQRDALHTVTLEGGNRWGQSGVKPLADLDTWAMRVLRRTGAKPNTVVMDVDAWNVFKTDAEVTARLDTRRIEGASLQMGGPAEIGGTYMGHLDGYRIFTYADWFLDPETGEELPILPSGTVLMGSGAIEGTRAFGAIRDEEAGYLALPFFPKSWTDPDPSVRYIMTQSAPLTVPTRPNASLAATVL